MQIMSVLFPSLISYIPGSTVMTVVVVQLLSHVRIFVTPWTEARQASLSFTISHSLLKLMSIELVMPSKHLVLCHPLLLLPSIFFSIRVFSNESALHIRWPSIGVLAATSVMLGVFVIWLNLTVMVGMCDSLPF